MLFLFAASFWVGSIAFMSFIVAPTLFRELPREVAGDFVGKLFPHYYTLGYVCGAIAFASLLLRGFFDKPFPWLRLALLALMLGCSVYAGSKVHPDAHMLKTVAKSMEDGPEKEAKQAEFGKLHRLSVILNSVVFLAGVAVLFITGYRLT